eukprot:RCo009240
MQTTSPSAQPKQKVRPGQLLFRNPQTARRFPLLAKVTPEQLEALLPPSQLQEPEKLPVPADRSIPSDEVSVRYEPPVRPAWRPSNPQQAKKTVGRGAEALTGNHRPYDALKQANWAERQHAKEKRRSICPREFLPYISPALATSSTRADYFMDSADSATKELHRAWVRAKQEQVRQLRKGSGAARSEECRVRKDCRSRWQP